MDTILQGFPGVMCYIDDILVTGASDEEHLARLGEVLKRLQECVFLQKSVEYLGHLLDAEGLHPLQDKLAAIQQAPAPTNVQQLKSFLGLVPDLSPT